MHGAQASSLWAKCSGDFFVPFCSALNPDIGRETVGKEMMIIFVDLRGESTDETQSRRTLFHACLSGCWSAAPPTQVDRSPNVPNCCLSYKNLLLRENPKQQELGNQLQTSRHHPHRPRSWTSPPVDLCVISGADGQQKRT